MSPTPVLRPGDRPRVTVVGLGPAGPELTTPAASRALASAEARFLRTARHPAAKPWVDSGVRSFDHHYEEGSSFEDTYAHIVEDLVRAANDSGCVVYAVPGSPSVLEATVEMLREDARVEVDTVAGLSFLDLAWDRLRVDPVNAGVRLVNGEVFSVDAAGERGPLLISHTWSNEILSRIKLSVEPETSTVAVLCHHLGLEDEVVLEVAWDDLDREIRADHLTCLYIPELAQPPAYELARAAQVVAHLRSECPWDARQTHESLVRHLLEETYEAIEAIEGLGEPPDLAASELLEEELGDVLCQVFFHATIASEEGLFGLADVARTLADKLIRRHPHVYGQRGTDVSGTTELVTTELVTTDLGTTELGIDVSGTDADGRALASDGALARSQQVLDAEQVLSNWERQKLVEKGRSSLLEGVPAALPALAYAAKLEKKLASVDLGLDAQFEQRGFASHVGALGIAGESDYGDLLLAIARRAAHEGVDPEAALRKAARVFRDRFVAVEALAVEQGRGLVDLDVAERRALWEQVREMGT